MITYNIILIHYMNYESIVVYVRAVNMKKPYQYSYTYYN